MAVKPIYADSMKELKNECNPSSNCDQCEKKVTELETKVSDLQKQVATLSEGLVDVHNTFGDKVVFKAFCPNPDNAAQPQSTPTPMDGGQDGPQSPPNV